MHRDRFVAPDATAGPIAPLSPRSWSAPFPPRPSALPHFLPSCRSRSSVLYNVVGGCSRLPDLYTASNYSRLDREKEKGDTQHATRIKKDEASGCGLRTKNAFNDLYNLYNYYISRKICYEISFKKRIFLNARFYTNTQQTFFVIPLFAATILALWQRDFVVKPRQRTRDAFLFRPHLSVLPCRSTPCRFAASSLLLAQWPRGETTMDLLRGARRNSCGECPYTYTHTHTYMHFDVKSYLILQPTAIDK